MCASPWASTVSVNDLKRTMKILIYRENGTALPWHGEGGTTSLRDLAQAFKILNSCAKKKRKPKKRLFL